MSEFMEAQACDRPRTESRDYEKAIGQIRGILLQAQEVRAMIEEMVGPVLTKQMKGENKEPSLVRPAPQTPLENDLEQLQNSAQTLLRSMMDMRDRIRL